jgi:hypothetical protein
VLLGEFCGWVAQGSSQEVVPSASTARRYSSHAGAAGILKWQTRAGTRAGTVCGTAGLPTGSRRRYKPLAFHGRTRTTFVGWSQDAANLLVEQIVVAVNAVGVVGEQDCDAVPGPSGDLGRVSSGVQPQRQGGVPHSATNSGL